MVHALCFHVFGGETTRLNFVISPQPLIFNLENVPLGSGGWEWRKFYRQLVSKQILWAGVWSNDCVCKLILELKIWGWTLPSWPVTKPKMVLQKYINEVIKWTCFPSFSIKKIIPMQQQKIIYNTGIIYKISVRRLEVVYFTVRGVTVKGNTMYMVLKF